MTNNRYRVWVVLIVLSISLQLVGSFFSSISRESTEVELAVDMSKNLDIDRKLAEVGRKGLKIKKTPLSGTTSVLISDKYTDLAGYVKYEGVLSTPIVLFAPVKALETHIITGFTKVNDSSYLKQVDMYSVIVGLEQDKTWQEIGISEEIVSGNIRLVIPRENSPYYPYIVESIYGVLLQGLNDITEQDIDKIQDRVSSILLKCEKVDDLLLPIEHSIKNKNNNLDYLVLGPESIITDNRGIFNTGTSINWMPIYFKNTSEITLDVFIKDSIEPELFKDIEDLVLVAYNVNNYIGYRSDLRNFEIRDKYKGFYCAVNTVHINNISDEVRLSINNRVQEEIRNNGVTLSVVKPNVLIKEDAVVEDAVVEDAVVEDAVVEDVVVEDAVVEDVSKEIEVVPEHIIETSQLGTKSELEVSKLDTKEENVAVEKTETVNDEYKSLVKEIKDGVENKETTEQDSSEESESEGNTSVLYIILLPLFMLLFVALAALFVSGF